MLNLKKLINDYYGVGSSIIVPYSKKLTNGKEVNISKYSGLVSVVKRRDSKSFPKGVQRRTRRLAHRSRCNQMHFVEQ